jgi:hypothetical protein
MKTFKVYMPDGSSGSYHAMKEELAKMNTEETSFEHVGFFNDPKWLCFGGKAYAVFTAPDEVTPTHFRKYGMKARMVDAGELLF